MSLSSLPSELRANAEFDGHLILLSVLDMQRDTEVWVIELLTVFERRPFLQKYAISHFLKFMTFNRSSYCSKRKSNHFVGAGCREVV